MPGRTSYSKEIVKAVQDHILDEFGDDSYDDDRTPEERFVDQIDSHIGGAIRTPEESIVSWVQGSSPEIYNEDKAKFLKSIGVDDGKTHDVWESGNLYDRIFIRDGTKLYRDIVSGKRKPNSRATKSESPKRTSSIDAKSGSGKGSERKSGGRSAGDGKSRMEVRSIYFDPTESKAFGRPVFDVIIVDGGTSEKVWGKDFNPVTLRAAKYYRNQTEKDISEHVKGHTKVRSFTVPAVKSPKSCKRERSGGSRK